MARFTRVFGIPELRVQFVRGLRFRLMLSYVFFFALLLIAIGLLFRQTLQSELNRGVSALLEKDWDAAKALVDIVNEQPVWAEPEDDQEAQAEARLQQVYFIADQNGNSLGDSEAYRSIGLDPLPEIRRILAQPSGYTEVLDRTSAQGVPYRIQRGILTGLRGKRYFLAIGTSLVDSRQTVRTVTGYYFLLVPLLVALSSLLGWMVAGRALKPVNLVAQAAQNITGSNLSLKIPLRGAGDELDRLIDSFNRMTARLADSFEQIRRFSTDVSHELRTPLTAIRGQLEVALFTAQTPEQYRDAMVNALEDVEQLSSIVRALLLLSQAESGQLVLQKAPLDLGDVVLDVVDQFQIPAQEKNIALTAQIVPGCIIPADRVQIERLIANLLSNAVKYTPAGGSVRVRLGPSDSPVFVALEIEDTGVGIPAENLPHIFDRFYRVRNAETNKIHGLGLGLSFVSWIVQVHGGRMDVASAVGEGTRFRILLPREAEISQAAPAETVASSLH